ncbi:MAG: hypothetical protein ABR518_07255 [Actinomycetota bacterium]
MATRTFPKVWLVPGAAGADPLRARDRVVGELIVEGTALEHRSAQGSVRMEPIRTVARKGGIVTVTYGEREAIQAVRLMDVSGGVLRATGAGKALAAQLGELVRGAPSLAEEEVAMLRTGIITDVATYSAPIGRRGRTIKWILGPLALLWLILAGLAIAGDAAGLASLFLALMALSLPWYLYFAANDRKARRAAAAARSSREPGPPPS